ncbi:MAG: IS481 family transposase, partial [Gammaproteobacteria bacterium]|nr:IS481 family transposase [Gammaproteobacteria bacterium]
MNIQLHKNARTTPAIRREIQQAPASISTDELARRLELNRITVRKWRKRASTEDGPRRPHKLYTQLTPTQELLVVEIRKVFLLSLNDLPVVTHEFINNTVSRSGLDRCLRRHGVSNLKALIQA